MRGITVTRIQNSLEALRTEDERHGVRPVMEHIHHPSLPGVSHFMLFQLGAAFMEVHKLCLSCGTFPRQVPLPLICCRVKPILRSPHEH